MQENSGLVFRSPQYRHPQKHYIHKKLFRELFLLSGHNYNYNKHCREKYFLHVPLFPVVQSINYNYINNFLENYLCRQVTITIYKNYSPANYLRNNFVPWKMLVPTLCRADLGWIFYFGPANFRKIAGEFLSEFWWRISIANVSALFFQGFRPTKKFTPKIHVQNCRLSSPISLSWTQNLFTAIFCLRGRPKDAWTWRSTSSLNLMLPLAWPRKITVTDILNVRAARLQNGIAPEKNFKSIRYMLRLTFPRAKLWRQIFMTGQNSGWRIGRKVGRNFGRNFLGIFVLHWLCRTTHQIFSQNSSQFITPCLVTAPVTEISKFHLRELLGLGVPNIWFHIGLKNAKKDPKHDPKRVQNFLSPSHAAYVFLTGTFLNVYHHPK